MDEVRAKTESMKVGGVRFQGSFEHVSQVCGDAVDRVMTKAMEYESMDNLSVVIITFKNFTRFVESMEPQQGIGSQMRNKSQLNVMDNAISPMSLMSPGGGDTHSS